LVLGDADLGIFTRPHALLCPLGDFVAEFERTVSAKVIALDIAGNGIRCRQQSPVSVAEMAADCRAQCRSMGVTGPVHILALSMGAMVATEWATQWPDEVMGLVLISTSMRPLNPFWQRMRPGAAALLMRTFASANAQRKEQAILRLTSNHRRYDVLPEWCEERARHPVQVRNALRQLLAAARYRVPHDKPKAATLVLGGEKDRLVSVECSRALATHWGCDIALHPTAGHDLTLDDGPWVIGELTRWLQRIYCR